MLAQLAALRPPVTDVSVAVHSVTAADGTALEARWYTRDGATPGPAVLYLHGGGMILGSLDIYDPFVRALVSASGVSMLAVEYRLAPEHPHPVPVEDCYAALVWLASSASTRRGSR